MGDPETFIELVHHICRRPKMFTMNGTFGEVAAYFTAIASTSGASPLSDDDDRVFNFFVTARLLVPSKYWWPGAIMTVAADDADAIARLRDLLVDFATLRKTKSFNEIASEAAKTLSEYEDTEPAKTWRRFLAARYHARQHEIEPLIMPHPKAAVLWRGNPTPPGVAEQLTEISDSYVVSIVSGSLESGHVRLATEIGIMDAHLVDGAWRIDASSLIEIAASRDA